MTASSETSESRLHLSRVAGNSFRHRKQETADEKNGNGRNSPNSMQSAISLISMNFRFIGQKRFCCSLAGKVRKVRFKLPDSFICKRCLGCGDAIEMLSDHSQIWRFAYLESVGSSCIKKMFSELCFEHLLEKTASRRANNCAHKWIGHRGRKVEILWSFDQPGSIIGNLPGKSAFCESRSFGPNPQNCR